LIYNNIKNKKQSYIYLSILIHNKKSLVYVVQNYSPQFFSKQFLLIICIVIIGIISCTKMDVLKKGEKPTDESLTNRFFTEHRTADPTETKLVNFVKRKYANENIADKIIKIVGLPRWNKISVYKDNNASIVTTAGSTTTFYVPLVIDSQNYVNAAMAIQASATDTTLTYLQDWKYKNLQNNTNSYTDLAEKFALSFMIFDKDVFGYSKFKILDSNLFQFNNHRIKTVSIDTAFEPNIINGLREVSLCITTTLSWTNCYAGNPNCEMSTCNFSISSSVCNTVTGDPSGGGGGTSAPSNPPSSSGSSNTPGGGSGWIPILTNNNPNRKIIDSLNGYPCAQQVLAAMPSINAQTKSILLNTFGINTNINLVFEAYDYPDSTIDGETSRIFPSGDYRIRLNKSMLNTATKEYIAAVIMHEAIHAYIKYMRPVNQGGGGGMDSITFAQTFPIFSSLVIAPGSNASHNQMAYSYLNTIKSVVLGINDSLSNYNAEAISWGGLENTTVWRNRSDTNSLSFRNTVAKFANRRHADSTGILVDFRTFGYKKCLSLEP
jgi:hypothetical protein